MVDVLLITRFTTCYIWSSVTLIIKIVIGIEPVRYKKDGSEQIQNIFDNLHMVLPLYEFSILRIGYLGIFLYENLSFVDSQAGIRIDHFAPKATCFY